MVYPETFNPQQNGSRAPKIASVNDRLLSFIIDMLIFWPLFSLILIPLLGKLEVLYYISPEKSDWVYLASLVAFLIWVFSVVTRTVCVYYWGQTPGQFFLKLKVVSLTRKPITLTQAFLRSVIWGLEVLLLGVPFLEVLGHPERRALHDRASETMVVTRKQQGDTGPHFLETKFIRQSLFSFSLAAFFWIFLVVIKLYQSGVSGGPARAVSAEPNKNCESVTESLPEKVLRPDHVLSMVLVGQISEECLNQELEGYFWSEDLQSQSWAYLIKGFAIKEEIYEDIANDSEDYFRKVCEKSETSELCTMARGQYSVETELLSNKFLWVKERLPSTPFQDVSKHFPALLKDEVFTTFIQAEKVKNLWLEKSPERALGGYEILRTEIDPDSHLKLASWMCLRYLHGACSQASFEPCQATADFFRDEDQQVHDPKLALVLIRDHLCRRTSDFSWRIFNELFRRDPQFYALVRSLSPEVEMTSQQRADAIRKAMESKSYDGEIRSLISAIYKNGFAKEERSPASLSSGSEK